MFHYRAFERLENDATFLQLIRNHIALNQLITGENHTASDVIEPARLFENRGAFSITRCAGTLELRKIEKTDVGKTPRLIFSRRIRQCLELIPSCMLLIAEPIREIAGLDWPGEDPLCLAQLIMCD